MLLPITKNSFVLMRKGKKRERILCVCFNTCNFFQVQRVLLELEMKNIQDILARNLSGGQKRKLTFGTAILGDSQVSQSVVLQVIFNKNSKLCFAKDLCCRNI